MQRSRQHHRVPQFLLRYFSADNIRIGIYTVGTGGYHGPGPINNQARDRGFYPEEGEDNLSRVEGEISSILNRASFSMGDFNNLALYALIQYIRTQRYWSPQEQRPQFLEDFLGCRRFSYEYFRNTLADRAFDLETMSQAFKPDLQQIHKVLLLNKTSNPYIGFITNDVAVGFSDRLLYFELARRMNHNRHTSLLCPGSLLFFPISKDRCLLFYNRHTYSINDRNNKFRISCKQDVRDINRCLLETGRDDIMFFNNIYYDLRMDFSYEDHVLKGSNSFNEAAIDMPIEHITSPAFSFLSVQRKMKDLQTQLYKETNSENDLVVNHSRMIDRHPELFLYPPSQEATCNTAD